MCNESGEVFNISTESTYTFLMADDQYEPDFAEYIGLSIYQAMHLEINEIAEQIAGAGVTCSFNVISVELSQINDFVISSVLHYLNYYKQNVSDQDEPRILFAYNGHLIKQGADIYRIGLYLESELEGCLNKNLETMPDWFTLQGPWKKNGQDLPFVNLDDVPEDAILLDVNLGNLDAIT